jgi:hypothetical protein
MPDPTALQAVASGGAAATGAPLSAAAVQSTPLTPEASLHLLEQDNSIPGNRADGFRYNHLLFIIVLTPVYLWFELSFGVRLLDGISTKVAAGQTDAIEHWGRIISGCAVALLFLSGWVRQCEKLAIAWPARIIVGVALTFACIAVTWWGQDRLIDFYVRRTTANITLELALLLALVVTGLLIMRAWLRYAVRNGQCASRRVLIGLVVILATGYAMMRGVAALLPDNSERLGLERQRAATLTLVRKAVQDGYYNLMGVERDERLLASPEGKAFFALFPVFGKVLNQERFAKDRPMLLAEAMYRDWDEESGAQAYSAYQDVVHRLKTTALDAYDAASQTYHNDSKALGVAAARQRWDDAVRPLFEGEAIAPGLSRDAFLQDPALKSYLRKKLGCFDCEFKLDMDRQAFGREFFKWTQANNVRQAVETFASAKHFESGRDGERAARTYWVPIWALLFSMLGAFTHIFKMIFTTTEYAHRLAFKQIRAADSQLANHVIHNSRIVTAAVVLGMGLFIYFSDNRVTAHEKYLEIRPQMWRGSPIVGGIAAHWTVNAQGLLYPFTRKIRPSWLAFDEDPLARIPFLAHRLSHEDD